MSGNSASPDRGSFGYSLALKDLLPREMCAGIVEPSRIGDAPRSQKAIAGILGFLPKT